MSPVPVESPSDYDILSVDSPTVKDRHDFRYSIIRRSRGGRIDNSFTVIVPDCGSAEIARSLLKFFRDKEVQSRQKKIDDDAQWLESLKEPHEFIRKSAENREICWCEKWLSDPIHVEEKEDVSA